MFRRYSEMYIDLATFSGSIHSTFSKMFFERGTRAFGIFVEFEQPFRKCTVIQSGRFEQCGYHSFIIAFFQ